jgi:toxin ParE1/3/4
MLAKIERSSRAEQDLIDIWKYIAEDSPKAADRVVDHFRSTLQMLALNPFMGRRRDELARGLRSFAVGEYLIFYLTGKSGILLVRVLSGYRNLEALFE